MKKLTLLSAVALSCCAVSPSFAQVQILRSGAPTQAPQLLSDQPNLVEPLPGDANSTAAALQNPFDYFDQAMPQLDQPEPAVREVEPGLLTDAPVTDQAGRESKPASLPVGGRHHRPSVVDTIINQDMLGNIPNASSVPVFWGGTPQTPNPVAEWLLREECVDGLWANYPQQRAAECAHMWNHIAGRHPCGCAGGQCSTVTTSCAVCSSHATAAPRNRYLERLSAAPAACDTSAQAAPVIGNPAAAGDSFRSGNGLPTDDCTRCAQQISGNVPANEPPAATKTSEAKLPTLGWFR